MGSQHELRFRALGPGGQSSRYIAWLDIGYAPHTAPQGTWGPGGSFITLGYALRTAPHGTGAWGAVIYYKGLLGIG